MPSYSDNKKALKLSKILKLHKKEQMKQIQILLDELDLGISKIDDICIQFWKEGVHYYKPFKISNYNKIL